MIQAPLRLLYGGNPLASESKNSSLKSLNIFGDYLIMLVFPCALSAWYYGMPAVRTLAVTVVTGFICDFFGSILVYKKFYAADLSSFCASIMIALMMPAGIPAYIPVLAAAFSVMVIKIPFGGGMQAPFVPAAAGFAFVAVCFKDEVFTYLPGREYMGGVSLGSTLMHGGAMRMNGSNILDILTGNIAGPMGTGCIIVFAACMIYLLVRRREALLATAGFLGACIIFALVFPRSNGSRLAGMIMELSSGSLMFASVFLLTDYSALPAYRRDKLAYGIFCGIICMAMRKLGAFEEPVCFAVLLANAFSPLLDILTKRIMDFIAPRKQRREVSPVE